MAEGGDMPGCCDADHYAGGVDRRQRRVLWIVLTINAVMFVVLMAAALWGKTAALFADSFDNLGDAATYAISLWAVGKGASEKAKVSLFKGVLILAAACAILINVVYKFLDPQIPVFEIMGLFSALALVANLVCLALLWRHRSDDLNMESVWHCSRNDIATNISVFIAAGLVWYFNSWWPDVIVAGCLAILLFSSAFKIIVKSFSDL